MPSNCLDSGGEMKSNTQLGEMAGKVLDRE